jgi:hypothetical protein
MSKECGISISAASWPTCRCQEMLASRRRRSDRPARRRCRDGCLTARTPRRHHSSLSPFFSSRASFSFTASSSQVVRRIGFSACRASPACPPAPAPSAESAAAPAPARRRLPLCSPSDDGRAAEQRPTGQRSLGFLLRSLNAGNASAEDKATAIRLTAKEIPVTLLWGLYAC